MVTLQIFEWPDLLYVYLHGKLVYRIDEGSTRCKLRQILIITPI